MRGSAVCEPSSVNPREHNDAGCLLVVGVGLFIVEKKQFYCGCTSNSSHFYCPIRMLQMIVICRRPDECAAAGLFCSLFF